MGKDKRTRTPVARTAVLVTAGILLVLYAATAASAASHPLGGSVRPEISSPFTCYEVEPGIGICFGAAVPEPLPHLEPACQKTRDWRALDPAAIDAWADWFAGKTGGLAVCLLEESPTITSRCAQTLDWHDPLAEDAEAWLDWASAKQLAFARCLAGDGAHLHASG